MKYKILYIFSFLTLTIPGSIKSTKPRFFLSPISFGSFAILIFVLFDLGYLIHSRLFSSPEPPDPSKADSDNVEVIGLSATLYNIIVRITNILIRCLAWFFFPRARAVFAQLSTNEEFQRYKEWTGNELTLVFLIFVSIIIEQIEVFFPSVSRFDSGFSEEPSPFVKIGGMCCSYFGSFASLDFLSLFFLSFVSLFTKDLERLALAKESNDLETIPNEDQKASQESNLNNSGLPLGIESREANSTESSMTFTPAIRQRSVSSSESGGREEVPGSYAEIQRMAEGFISSSRLWAEASDVTGLLVLIYFFVKTVSVAVLSFFCLSFATDFGLKNGKTMIFIVSTLVMVGKLLCLGNGAHALIKANGKLVSRVEKVAGVLFNFSPTANFYTGFQKAFHELHADNLVLYMKENPSSISALRFFTLSRNTLTSILGLVITFLVVLVQFKVAT